MRRLTLVLAIGCTGAPPANDPVDGEPIEASDADTDADSDADSDADADADTDADSDADTDADTDTDTGPLPVRVLTWNVEGLGVPGSDEFLAVHDVLARIDADVVALNELDYYEEDELVELATSLGYSTVVVAYSNPFGGLHNGIMTRLVVTDSEVWTSDVLSGDPDANDVTRLPVSVDVLVGASTLTVVSQHWKSGFYLADEFRRVVDSLRTAQAAAQAPTDAVVVTGDVNYEIDEIGSFPVWDYAPDDLPFSYELGDDLQAALDDPAGIPNDVYVTMYDIGLVVLDALQMDGNAATRDVSGREIDKLFVHPTMTVIGTEIYDSRDEGLVGLPKPGPVPSADACETASDHFPVYVDLEL